MFRRSRSAYQLGDVEDKRCHWPTGALSETIVRPNPLPSLVVRKEQTGTGEGFFPLPTPTFVDSLWNMSRPSYTLPYVYY